VSKKVVNATGRGDTYNMVDNTLGSFSLGGSILGTSESSGTTKVALEGEDRLLAP
jgi:hypothetical protein